MATALTSLGVPFHLTGGLASSYYGEPRSTRDADSVVRLEAAEGSRLVRVLSGPLLIEAAAVREAIRANGVFQALDVETLMKADFHVGERIPGEHRRSVLTTRVLPGRSNPAVRGVLDLGLNVGLRRRIPQYATCRHGPTGNLSRRRTPPERMRHRSPPRPARRSFAPAATA